jgi:hypothetical protein
VAAVLQGGTILSVVAIAIGLVWAVLTGSEAPVDETAVELIAHGGPDAVIAVGLLALTLIPVAMLLAAASVLAELRERRPLVVTALVVLLLVASLVAAALIGASA